MLRASLVTSVRILLFGFCVHACAAETVDFENHIKPIIESACLHCHNEGNAEGELRLDSLAAALRGGSNGPAIVPGKSGESRLLQLTLLGPDDDMFMPPEEPALDKAQTDLIAKWIDAGAKWPESVRLEITPRIEFAKHVQPILEQNCVSCHHGDDSEAGFDLTSRTSAFKSGDNAPAIKPFDADASPLHTLTTLSKGDDSLMPPANSGGPLKEDEIAILKNWINQGAIWPASINLQPRAKEYKQPDGPDNLELVERIREKILETQANENGGEDYSAKVPQTGADYHMVAIAGGKFLMGSPQTEKHRSPTEGPQVEVTLPPFWIGKYEVTWDEYEPFMITTADRRKDGARTDYDPKIHTIVDAVSQPTGPYTEMSFKKKKKGFPAISMTQHAASKYCQWL
ncbi:MAG: SUMF1/EgtB/PvdO family nonheme iron enzyme, partial [Planctomycetales bacterium]|nr:SUMF1/EgtB/PvdO family nonheme iron enzyme [Planctomycetales bacterium]